MPKDIDPETMNVDDLPGVWSPVQWELSEEEAMLELDMQAKANLLYNVDIPETILRLLLDEHEVERAYAMPQGFDPEQQGEWDENLITFQFKRSISLEKVEREENYLYVEYKITDLGTWGIEIEPDGVSIYRL
jgi:hypothetical protein